MLRGNAQAMNDAATAAAAGYYVGPGYHSERLRVCMKCYMCIDTCSNGQLYSTAQTMDAAATAAAAAGYYVGPGYQLVACK